MKISDQEKYNKAKKKVIKLRQFYDHLFFFVSINLGMIALNYYQDKLEYPWFLWMISGWLIGLLSHAINVFGKFSKLSWNNKWEERKINEILNKKEPSDRWE